MDAFFVYGVMIWLVFLAECYRKRGGGGGFIVLHLSLVNPPLELSLDQTAGASFSAQLHY